MLQLVEPQPALQGRRVRRGVAGEHDVSRGSWFAAHPALEREVGRVHECEGLAHCEKLANDGVHGSKVVG